MNLCSMVEISFYGIAIFATVLYELAHLPHFAPILFSLHPSIWWGGFMGIAVATYVIRHRPQKDHPEIRTLQYE